ncbi:MAG: hypothetical protein RMJ44_09620 [Cytophagales bacterium]|nr:hypothetical protein [Bernardetiaceae bacterium]MDW8211332.1 hypothetical protein [Cytophagales bacterium]
MKLLIQIGMFCLLGLPLSAQIPQDHPIHVFKSYITGDFDNRRQVEKERKKGTLVHPYAKHVNRVANEKIDNLPNPLNGFFLLEESYYKYSEGDTIVKPYLFFFEALPEGKVKLHAMQLPKELDPTTVRNDNPTLRFDYLTLQPSPTFKPAVYTQTKGGFYLKATTEFPGGSFTLEETIGRDKLEVMELLIRQGKQVTPYSTPLIYERIFPSANKK